MIYDAFPIILHAPLPNLATPVPMKALRYFPDYVTNVFICDQAQIIQTYRIPYRHRQKSFGFIMEGGDSISKWWKKKAVKLNQDFCWQEELDELSPDIMKLDLLAIMESPWRVGKQPTYVSFYHKLFQEFSASGFIRRELDNAKNMKVSICLCYL